jgi:hypothetical protein
MTMNDILPGTLWTEKGGVLWADTDGRSIRDLAGVMQEQGARFITITAFQLPGDAGFRMEYHWDFEGCLLGFQFVIPNKSVESIFDICEAADWIEREIYEGFGIEFAGRAYEPLQLRNGLKPGVTLREEVTK